MAEFSFWNLLKLRLLIFNQAAYICHSKTWAGVKDNARQYEQVYVRHMYLLG